MHLLECATWVDAQLGGEPDAEFPIMRECIRRAAAAVQGQHELRRQAFVERMLVGLGGEIAEQGAMLAEAQPQIGQVPFGRDPFGLQGIARCVGPGGVQAAQRRAAPEIERVAE